MFLVPKDVTLPTIISAGVDTRHCGIIEHQIESSDKEYRYVSVEGSNADVYDT